MHACIKPLKEIITIIINAGSNAQQCNYHHIESSDEAL